MSDYKIHKVWIDVAEFEILVIEFDNNKEEIEDKLAYLAREKGNIPKSFYEDFAIVNCVANINQLIFHIKQRQPSNEDLSNIRAKVMESLIKINPLFDPKNLIINRNSVVKVKLEDQGLAEDERRLTDNKFWNAPYYPAEEGSFGPQAHHPANEADDIDEETKAPKPTESLNHTVDKKWWKRINKYINIRKFKESNIKDILKQRFFHDRSSFQTYIVSVCVVDSESLFVMLDNMGIPNNTPPIILMHEIYELCLAVNPFLTYENAQDGFKDDNAYDEDDCIPSSRDIPNRMKSHANQNKRKPKKSKKKFKDVPKEELLRLGDTMKVFVIGQDDAIDNIVRAVQRASVGLKDPDRPIGSFLFAGRTGCGKTLTTKVLADNLIKDKNNLITIDCSEYSADHEYAKLIGAPAGYVGHESGGILTNAMNENPFSIVVFDEIEKASTKVHELMLQVLEEGRLTDGKGQKVSFKDAVIIMTSNVGVREIDDVKKTVGFGDVATLTEEKKIKSIDSAIKKKFKPEFINRIDSIVHFNSLTKNDYMRIIDIELYKLNENLRNNDTEYKNVALEFDKRIKDLVYKEGINEDFGARPLKRCIEKRVSDKVAEGLLTGTLPSDGTIKVSVRKNEIVFKSDVKEIEKTNTSCA